MFGFSIVSAIRSEYWWCNFYGVIGVSTICSRRSSCWDLWISIDSQCLYQPWSQVNPSSFLAVRFIYYTINCQILQIIVCKKIITSQWKACIKFVYSWMCLCQQIVFDYLVLVLLLLNLVLFAQWNFLVNIFNQWRLNVQFLMLHHFW